MKIGLGIIRGQFFVIDTALIFIYYSYLITVNNHKSPTYGGI